ncbi:MAG: phosphatase PAP2 family protein [Nitratireductor sp.]
MVRAEQLKEFFTFRYIERIALNIILVIAIIDLCLIAYKGSNIQWLEYAKSGALTLALILGGLAYRVTNRSERIASTFICAALLILFTVVMSLYNYLLLPLERAQIDEALAAIDISLGVDWPALMAWAAQNPVLNVVFRLVYMSTMAQITLLIVLLGLTGRVIQMDILLTSLIISAIITICFWGLYPSFGAVAVYEVPANISNAVAPMVGEAYARELKDLAANGPTLIGPYEVRGLIGFPSYHSVLAFITLFASRPLKFVFPVLLVLNIIMLPAILVQGGHHLIDVIAGFVLCACAWWVARHYVLANANKHNIPSIIPA